MKGTQKKGNEMVFFFFTIIFRIFIIYIINKVINKDNIWNQSKLITIFGLEKNEQV